MADKPEAFEQAKTDDEPAFLNVILSFPLRKIDDYQFRYTKGFPYLIQHPKLAPEDEDRIIHKDSSATFRPLPENTENTNGGDGGFDIKNVELSHLTSGNYSIKKREARYLKAINSPLRFFAFRLNDGVKYIDKFVVARTTEVLDERRCPHVREGDNWFLVNIEDVKRNCEFWIFESDIPS